jgi:hypothetical protein
MKMLMRLTLHLRGLRDALSEAAWTAGIGSPTNCEETVVDRVGRPQVEDASLRGQVADDLRFDVYEALPT